MGITPEAIQVVVDKAQAIVDKTLELKGVAANAKVTLQGMEALNTTLTDSQSATWIANLNEWKVVLANLVNELL